ncbi:MAG: hypothetical protein RLZZ244_1329 [Verrucomicrobiota bacterium]|jgi:hypothetical protein
MWPAILRGARWFACLLAIVLCVQNIRDLVDLRFGTGLEARICALLSVLGMGLAIALIAPELTAWTSDPVLRLMDRIILPGWRRKPEVSFSLARRYLASGRPALALKEFIRVTRNYPEELRGYREAIALAFHLAERESAEALLQKGLRRLRKAEEREELKAHYHALQSQRPKFGPYAL